MQREPPSSAPAKSETRRQRHQCASAGGRPRSSPAAAQWGAAGAGLEVGLPPADHRTSRSPPPHRSEWQLEDPMQRERAQTADPTPAAPRSPAKQQSAAIPAAMRSRAIRTRCNVSRQSTEAPTGVSRSPPRTHRKLTPAHASGMLEPMPDDPAASRGTASMKVGFIGVGNMGGPMCRNIIRNTNHQVVVFDLSPDAVKECTALGASAGTSVADVAAGCDVVITSLPVPRVVEEVALGAGGVAENAKSGTVFIDLSTNSPATAKRVHEGMKARGIQMLEAPVSGGTARAKDGTIVIMVGGDAAVFEQQLPLLKSFSGEVIHMGEIGYGSTAKLINNMLAFCNAAAAAEALMIGKRSGIDLKKLDAVIRNASGMSAGYGNMAT